MKSQLLCLQLFPLQNSFLRTFTILVFLDFKLHYIHWTLLGTLSVLHPAYSVSQLCLTVYDPMDGSLPGSSVYGVFQTRMLKWVAISFSRDLLYPENKPVSPASPVLTGRFFSTSSLHPRDCRIRKLGQLYISHIFLIS